MGIINKLKNRKNKAPMTSGAQKAAEGRSDLADAAGKLNEMRGDNVTAGSAAPASDSAMDSLVKKAKDIRIVDRSNEDGAITSSDSYRSSK